MLADGSSVKEIAHELDVSDHTIKNDLIEMRRNFGAKNNCNLVALAYQHGVLNGRQFID
jgi:DNA-binding NarL/FixJ family response regulator